MMVPMKDGQDGQDGQARARSGRVIRAPLAKDKSGSNHRGQGVSFLKELFVSRPPWRIFLRTLHGKAVLGFVAVRLGFQFGNMVVTVLFSEVVCAVLFIAAAPLSIPS